MLFHAGEFVEVAGPITSHRHQIRGSKTQEKPDHANLHQIRRKRREVVDFGREARAASSSFSSQVITTIEEEKVRKYAGLETWEPSESDN